MSFSLEQSRQIRNVLRLHPDDEVTVLDGSGTEMRARLTDVAETCTAIVVERSPNKAEPSVNLTLYQALLKGAKFETVLQQCTEIGVSRFVPVVTARSVPTLPSASRLARYQAIIREAAEQSGRGCLPTVSEPIPLHEALKEDAEDDASFMFWEEETERRLSQVPRVPKTSLRLFIGPEGGLTGDEVVQARNAGCEILTLGPRILRSDTAGVVTAALILDHFGQM